LASLFLRYSERCFAQNTDPSRFLFRISGQIVLTDEKDAESEAGTFAATLIDVRGAVIEGESVFDVFDSDSVYIGYFEALYDYDEDDFKPYVTQIVCEDDCLPYPNLLVIDKLVIYPQYRGKGLGLLALKALIHRHRSGVGLIAMNPVPLQFESKFVDEKNSDLFSRFGLDAYSLPKNKATAKLRKYYGRLGFKQVPQTEFMVRSSELPLQDPDLQSSDSC